MKLFNKSILERLISFFVVFIFLAPIVPLLLGLFSPGNKNWNFILTHFFNRELVKFALLVLMVCLISFTLSFFLAALICLYEFPGRNVFQYLLIFPFTIPSYIGAYAYHKFFDFASPYNALLRNKFGIHHLFSFDLFSFFGGVFIFSIFFYPYLYTALYIFFNKNIGELVGVSRTLKANFLSIILRILIPLSLPVIISGLTIIAMEVISDFGVTSYLGIQTFSSEIFKIWFAMNDLYSALKLASYLVPIILLLLFVCYQFGQVKTLNYSPQRKIELRKLKGFYSLLAVLICSIIMILGYFLPILVMLRYAIIVMQVKNYLSLLFQFVIGSLTLAMIPTILILIISSYMAHTTRKRFMPYREIFSFQYALPGLIVAVLIMFCISNFEKYHILPKGSLVTLRESFILLIFAYIQRFLLLGYHYANNGFLKIGLSYSQVAKTLGSSPGKTFWKIELPLILPTLCFAGLMIMIDTMKELPMTLFLRPFNFDTLAARTYYLVNDEMFAEGCPTALALIFLLGILIILSLIIIKSKKLSTEGRDI